MTIHIEPQHPSYEAMSTSTTEQNPTLWQHRLVAFFADVGAFLLSVSFVGVLVIVAGGGYGVATILGAVAHLALAVRSLATTGATPGQRFAAVSFLDAKLSTERAIVYTVLRPVVGPLDLLAVALTKRSIGDQIIGSELRRSLPASEFGRRWRARAVDLGVVASTAVAGWFALGQTVNTMSSNPWALRAYNEACGQSRTLSAVQLVEPANAELLLDGVRSCLVSQQQGWRQYVTLFIETMPASLKFGALLVLAVIVLLPIVLVRTGGRTAGQRLFDTPAVPAGLADARFTALAAWRLLPLLALPLVLVLPVWLVAVTVLASIIEPVVRQGNSVTDRLMMPAG